MYGVIENYLYCKIVISLYGIPNSGYMDISGAFHFVPSVWSDAQFVDVWVLMILVLYNQAIQY